MSWIATWLIYHLISWIYEKIFEGGGLSDESLLVNTAIKFIPLIHRLLSRFQIDHENSNTDINRILLNILSSIEKRVPVAFRDSFGAFQSLLLCALDDRSSDRNQPELLRSADALCLQSLRVPLVALAVLAVPERLFPTVLKRFSLSGLDLHVKISGNIFPLLQKCRIPKRYANFYFKSKEITLVGLANILNLKPIEQMLWGLPSRYI